MLWLNATTSNAVPVLWSGTNTPTALTPLAVAFGEDADGTVNTSSTYWVATTFSHFSKGGH
jgi:hypothetical protein